MTDELTPPQSPRAHRFALAPQEPGNLAHQLEREIVKVAASEKGQGEIPGLNNQGPAVDRFRSLDGTGRGAGGRGAWCAVFASYCAVVACARLGFRLPFKTSRGAKRLVSRVAKAGRWVIQPSSAESVGGIGPGDYIGWHRGTGAGDWRGHVELVASYDPETDTLETWAGNVGRNAVVKLRTYRDGAWRRRLYGVASLV